MQDNVRFTDSPHIAPGDLNGAVPPNVFAADSSLVWQARDGREHWVAFDLKVRRRVTQFVCTAGGERASRNPRECSLEYAASLSGPWALAKRFSGARDKRETVVDELRSKSGAAFVDARYFRLVVHSTFGGTSGRNHGATIASVRFIGDSPQQTPMSYQRDVAITSMAQLGELTFTQGFAALSNDGLTLIEGGCGCTAGDYTEGPFSKNVLIENNTFDSTSFVHDDNALHINNIAALQVTGCVPIGVCGDSGGALSSAPPFPFLLPSSEGGTLRIVIFAVPGAVLVSRLRYYDGRRVSDRSASPLPPLARSAMAIYSSLYSTGSGAIQSCDHPTKRLATASSRWTRDADGWWSAPLDGGSSLYLTNGTYFVAFVYAAGEAWHSAKAGGGEARYWKESAEQSARDPLPSNLVQNYSVWQNADAGFPIAALWSPVGQWCDAGGTLPPPFTPDNAGDIVVGWDRGHIQEPGNMLTGGRTFARNITILNNVFIAPKSDPWGGEWGNNFLHLGGVDGLVVRRNVMRRRAKRSNASGADVVVYSSTNVAVEGNRCELEGQAGELPCVMKNETTCAGALNKC